MSRLTLRSIGGLTIAALLASTACAHNAAEQKPTSSDTESSKKETRPQLVSVATKPADTTTGDTSGQSDLEAAVAALKNVNLFFGFNDANLTSDAQTKLSAVGDVLVKHAALKLEIEGNCDERGTEGYNLVLGQQRADAAKKYLVDLGVKTDQVTTLSYGAERPKDPGHNDAAWKENRRDDVVVTPPATK